VRRPDEAGPLRIITKRAPDFGDRLARFVSETKTFGHRRSCSSVLANAAVRR
jgi:hypothetical protein